jgi:peptidase-like protein
MREGISKPDLVISAGFSYGVVNAHNGCLHLEVQVDGKSAHAATVHWNRRARSGGSCAVNPLCVAQDAGATGVSADRDRQPQFTVGLVKGGINTNVVPDRVTFRLDRSRPPGATRAPQGCSCKTHAQGVQQARSYGAAESPLSDWRPGTTTGWSFLFNAPGMGVTVSAIAGMTHVAIEPVSAAIRTGLLEAICNAPRKRNLAPGDYRRLRPP